jgi:hypothetical protein
MLVNRRELLRRIALITGGGGALALSGGAAAIWLTRGSSKPDLVTGQRPMLDLLADMIIPDTDTPGAVAAGVPDFIALMVTEWYTDKERQIFFDGLTALDQACQEAGAEDFISASPEVRLAALSAAAADARTYAGGGLASLAEGKNEVDEDTPFFTKIRDLTVVGYYMSEIGATQERAYNPMPGHFDGEYDFAEVGRQWSS